MSGIKKSLIFITGAPRSGTSLLTKVIDSHPDIAILMENIFGNRRRHWQRADFWNSDQRLIEELGKTYSQLPEPVVGNKVITPDVWDAVDIIRFCHVFDSFKILFIVRNPKEVALSRLRREPEDFFKVFNAEARKNILLDFRSRFHAYISSWRQSVENYWKLRDAFSDKVRLVYYEDFCQKFETQIREIFKFLEIDFSEKVLRWFDFPHHDRIGKLVRDLKYRDEDVTDPQESSGEIPQELNLALQGIKWQYGLWKSRRL
jgi:hypothetical protein